MSKKRRKHNKSKANVKAKAKTQKVWGGSSLSKSRKIDDYDYRKWRGYESPKVVVKVPKLDIPDNLRKDMEDRMFDIFSVQSKSYKQDDMIEFVQNKLIEYGAIVEEDKYGNIYGTKGEADLYPCIVAHLDTVHSIIPSKNYQVYKAKDRMFAIDISDCSRTGIGGDDKVGIWIALEAVLRKDVVKVAFFKDEEVGTIGSSYSDTDFFNDVSFVLQADRRGYSDFVNNISGTELYSDEFGKAISHILSKYNKEETSGGLTDVLTLLTNGIDVSVANCSCGYYLPHTSSEYVKTNEVILTYNLFSDIIDEVGYTKRWEHEAKVRGYGNYGYSSPYYDYPYNRYKDDSVYRNRFTNIEVEEDYNASKTKPIKARNEDCTFCGSPLEYDNYLELYYCHNCQDYDYNKQV